MLKAPLSPTLSLMSALPQATDEDSPPNNFLTYTITSASAFPSYFSIIMVEGYAGTIQYNTACHIPSVVVDLTSSSLSARVNKASSLPLLSSVISVTRPLDYEQVPNGMIHLTVMAKDGGNPALNSTVPVTVEVIVSPRSHTTNTQNTHSKRASVASGVIICDVCHISLQSSSNITLVISGSESLSWI